MMTTKEIIELIVVALIVVVNVVYYSILAIKNGWVKKILATMNEAIKYAELNISGGENKFNYVLTKVEEKCEELGIPFVFIRKLVKKLINKTIEGYNVIKK